MSKASAINPIEKILSEAYVEVAQQDVVSDAKLAAMQLWDDIREVAEDIAYEGWDDVDQEVVRARTMLAIAMGIRLVLQADRLQAERDNAV